MSSDIEWIEEIRTKLYADGMNEYYANIKLISKNIYEAILYANTYVDACMMYHSDEYAHLYIDEYDYATSKAEKKINTCN